MLIQPVTKILTKIKKNQFWRKPPSMSYLWTQITKRITIQLLQVQFSNPQHFSGDHYPPAFQLHFPQIQQPTYLILLHILYYTLIAITAHAKNNIKKVWSKPHLSTQIPNREVPEDTSTWFWKPCDLPGDQYPPAFQTNLKKT